MTRHEELDGLGKPLHVQQPLDGKAENHHVVHGPGVIGFGEPEPQLGTSEGSSLAIVAHGCQRAVCHLFRSSQPASLIQMSKHSGQRGSAIEIGDTHLGVQQIAQSRR